MWKAILQWRNATTPGMYSSPAQRFFSRRTCSMLLGKTTDYTPQVQAEVQSLLIRKRQTAKTYYDRHTKPLPDLTIGQPIRVKCHPQIPYSNWEYGTVIGKEAPRSYGVQVNRRFKRKKRIHIRQPTTLPTSVLAVPQHVSMPQPDETKTFRQNQGHNDPRHMRNNFAGLPCSQTPHTAKRLHTVIVIRDYQPAIKILNPNLTHTTKNTKHERTKTCLSKDTHTQ